MPSHARICNFCHREVLNAIENEEWIEVVREDSTTLRLVAKKIQLLGSDTFVNVAVVMQGWTRHLCRDDRELHVDAETVTLPQPVTSDTARHQQELAKAPRFPPSLGDPAPKGEPVKVPHT